MTTRPYRPDDAAALLDLFRDTIRKVNSRDYSPDQIQAWASDEIDPLVWEDRFRGRFVRVAEIDQVIAGFTDLEPDGHIDRFFVSADCQGRGVGSRLIAELVTEARRLGLPRLFSEISITARPFFEHFGFRVITAQRVPCRGAELDNFRMELILAGDKA